MRRRRWSLLLILLIASGAARAGEAERRLAVRRGVAYLDKHLFSLPESQGTPRKPFTYSVAGLVYLMRGSRTGTDRPVARIADYLVDYLDEVERRSRDPNELPRAHGVAQSWSLIQYTWPVAMAGMFFAEMHERKLYRRTALDAIKRVLKLLEEAQQENGGWGHGRINPAQGPDPKNPFADRVPKLRGGYPDTLLASTNTVSMTVGILGGILGADAVPFAGRARAYYRKAQLPDGSFPYDPSQMSSRLMKVGVGRTAGAVFAMHALGSPRDRDYERAVAVVLDHLPQIPDGHGSPCLNLMHGALACRALGPKVLARFKKEFDPRIIAHQDEDGAFRCICSRSGFAVTCDSKDRLPAFASAGRSAYITALHTFVLLLEADNPKSASHHLPAQSRTR